MRLEVMGMRSRHAVDRQIAFRLALLVAAVTVAVQVHHGPPGSGYGCGSVIVSCTLVAVPLLAVGLVVRTEARWIAWAANALAVPMTALMLLALTGNWGEQTPGARALDSLATVARSWLPRSEWFWSRSRS